MSEISSTQTSTPHIQILPEHLINQIKAGEVVERPAALIKELLENSIDAMAKTIKIDIKENGIDLISVEDDGHGMPFDDLPIAFSRHATSKINKLEDLYSLSSYGFRGEALASISSISRTTCLTVPSMNTDAGGKIIIEGGKTIDHVRYKNSNQGTSIYIKDLFYNTPARLKFIRSKISEKNAIKRIINAFLLSNPDITFHINYDNEKKIVFSAINSDLVSERIQKIFFNNKTCDMTILPLNATYNNYNVNGYVSQYSSPGNAGKQQYLFVNKRLFSDKQLHQTVIRSLKDLWHNSGMGHYCIFLDIPSADIDINVHPGKTFVKFKEQGLLYSLVASSIKTATTMKQKTSNHFEKNNQYLLDIPEQNTFQAKNYLETDQEKNHYEIIKATCNHYLVTIDNCAYFLNASRLLALFIFQNLQNPISDENITPLLVSEPFNIPNDFNNKIQILQTWGFDFDIITNNKMALRTFPDFLNNFPVKEIILGLINYFSNKNNSYNKTSFLTHMNLLPDSFNINQIILLLNKFSKSNLIEENILSLITKENIEKSFFQNTIR